MREKEGRRKENKALILRTFSQFCLSDKNRERKKKKKKNKCVYDGSGAVGTNWKCVLVEWVWLQEHNLRTERERKKKERKNSINTFTCILAQTIIWFVRTIYLKRRSIITFNPEMLTKLKSNTNKTLHFISFLFRICTSRNPSCLTGSTIDSRLPAASQVGSLCVCKLRIMRSFFQLRSKGRSFLLYPAVRRKVRDTGVMACMRLITQLLGG